MEVNSMTECKYPEVEVELVGQDGNAFAILGAVSKAMKRANIPKDKIILENKSTDTITNIQGSVTDNK